MTLGFGISSALVLVHIHFAGASFVLLLGVFLTSKSFFSFVRRGFHRLDLALLAGLFSEIRTQISARIK